MRKPLMEPGMLAAVWENLTDSPAPHPSILDLFAKYISKGDWYADDFLIYLIESSLHTHTSSEARAIWIAEQIGADQRPTDTVTLKAA